MLSDEEKKKRKVPVHGEVVSISSVKGEKGKRSTPYFAKGEKEKKTRLLIYGTTKEKSNR